MWQLMKLTLLAAAVETASASSNIEFLRNRGSDVTLIDATYGGSSCSGSFNNRPLVPISCASRSAITRENPP